MPAVFEHPLTVTPEHIDQLGHANNLEYLRWALAAALAHSAAQGWPVEAYERMGAGFVVRSHEIKYLISAFAATKWLCVPGWPTFVAFRACAATRSSGSAIRQCSLRRPPNGPSSI